MKFRIKREETMRKEKEKSLKLHSISLNLENGTFLLKVIQLMR